MKSVYTIVVLVVVLHARGAIPDYFRSPFLPHYTGACENPEQEKHVWRVVHDLYKKHISETPHYSPRARIPYIIHQIWLGSPLPENSRNFKNRLLSIILIGAIFCGPIKK